ncbi:hypothetical protein QYE76_021090 [Lolium multiflorum]|uniref:Reverse transcriptase domain-containing protein n=1 Tax=Lolium multiflorum TaxID=4521 RepID=A0AAD8VST6_LOLMU|nr:hypothetical protein QYE76_021090 [Lolium multiflorum]
MIALLKEYPDCFAWDYTEMPGLDRSIIEHRLPLKKGFRPFQQRARQMKAEILEEVKKEIEKMLNAGFIRPCRYAEWISNVVPVEKKDGRWRVAIDFRNLNSATPKDEYPMPVAETLINAAAGHKVLSFMDGNAGYNQIFMAPEDIHKTAFRVPGSVGLFEYVVMTFGLKNAGATYQRAMNYIFHDLIGKLVEIYIDDVVVKSVSVEGHLEDLRHVLDRTRKFGLRMNPKKCAFGVSAGQFLGFLVHERGIEIGLKSQEAVRTMQPPTTKKELQSHRINFVRRFISNLSGRIEPFMGLVKIKSDDEFQAEQQQAFDEIKEYLMKPPVLVPPQQDRPFYIYLSVADTSIASVVVQVYDGLEKVVFYLSRRMLDAETRYPEIEKLCLCLFFTCTKLHHILWTAEIVVICKSDVIKHMLSAPVLKGRLGKWMFALSEFDIRYQPAKAVKGQALADLIVERINTDIAALSVRAWAMFFDGSVCDGGCGIGILIVSPRGATYSFSIRLPTPCTNNVAEYEAIRKGMELLLEAGAEAVELFGDSKLVISQLTEEYKCESESLFPLWMQCPLMSDSIEDVTELRLWSLEKIKENKAKVARAYNKKVRPKEFHVGDLVWEAVLPLGTKDAVYATVGAFGEVLVAADEATGRGVHLPLHRHRHRRPTRRKRLAGGYSSEEESSSSSSSSSSEERFPSHEKRSSSLAASSSPSTRNWRSSSPSVRGSSSSDSLEKSQSHASQYWGAGLVDGHQIDLRSSSLEEERTEGQARGDEEEEESMAAEKGFLFADGYCGAGG